jgi:hypothetical protein
MMIEWPQIAYGAVLCALAAAAVLTLVARPRRLSVIGTGAAAAALGALAWNAILLAVDGRQFFVDAPIAVFPVSWQDTGSGVFALAAASMLLGFGPLRSQPSKRCAGYAAVVALAALVVDVYLY